MSTATPGPMVSVQQDVSAQRYVISRDGVDAGFVAYHLSPGVIAFLHTEIAPEFGGQGLAGTLIKTVLDDAREKGLRVEPYCPFVLAYLTKHPDYLDLVDPADRSRFGL